MSQRKKLWQRMRGPGKKNIRFDELDSFAKYYGFSRTIRGADYVYRHILLERHVFINRPHGGRDCVRPHDIDRFAEAIEELIELGYISDLAADNDEEGEEEGGGSANAAGP